MSIRHEEIKVYDMTCTSCEKKVEKEIKKLDGIIYTEISFINEFAIIEYDDDLCNLDLIKAAITTAGYSTKKSKSFKLLGLIIIATIVILLGFNTSGFDIEGKLENASYAALFIVGILSSIHCVGMCGGIMLSQNTIDISTNKSRLKSIKPSILYNAGRVASYTLLGGIFGAMGSILSFSITTKAIIEVIAGIFMIMMGFNISGFKLFRWFNIKIPSLSCKSKNKFRSPFIIGFLNGLMPCGPLQTMQLFALGTGNALKGALAMFVFSIGTVPLMVLFGALSGLLTKGLSKKLIKFSGILIIVLGLVMGNRGLTLAGLSINPTTILTDGTTAFSDKGSSNSSNSNVYKATLKGGVQTINMSVGNRGYTPNIFYVQKDIPVKWIVDAKLVTSCNSTIVARSLDLQKKLVSGENIIEFTPSNKDISFSCWMGMLGGVIKVVDKLDTVDLSKVDSTTSSATSSDFAPSKQYSFNGTDITNVPTGTIIQKSTSVGIAQYAKFKGTGNSLEPLVIVTGNSSSTKLTFDLNAFDNAEGEYKILDILTKEEITSFTAKKGINEVTFNPKRSGSFEIKKGDFILGVIEVVDDINSVNPEVIRATYF
ncbi:sulfite exporter TauE/SafE family protein [Clostridium sp. YIM B02551]|uniref:urease accessory protein UreH domain-containing protein n=1 Tax=Clostridium sp. YIM B02551 TaxID=2910679 RepID=UPI001EEA6296|nr:sulfite exporter TauE/SafE family protein [Clostridium sp. YIM B02551]